MEYECQTTPFDKLVITISGESNPLCNSCKTPDCSNPIREHTVSKMGINTKMRLWTVGNVIRQVIACKGYIGESDEISSIL